MHYRRLGKSNLKVSALCLGTMMFGRQTPFEEAANIVASAREHGLNFIDTADVYNQGQSEKDLGQLLNGQRQYWVLASKLGNPMSQAVNESHYSRRWLVQETDAILARLQTDYLDILYLHRDFHDVNLEEAVRALGDLITAGKIRSLACRTFAAGASPRWCACVKTWACRRPWCVSLTTTCSTEGLKLKSCPPAGITDWA